MPDRYLVFDTETTGIDKDKQAVEIAMIEIDPDTLEELGREQSLIKPTCPISPEAEAVHGISLEMLKDAPTVEEWVDATFGPGGMEGEVALIGHRIDFDIPLFAPIGKHVTSVDTLLLTQLFCPIETENRKLDTLKEVLGLPGGGESHRAMADTMTAHQLLRFLMPLTGRTLEAIATTEIFVLHEMPWGRHEGKPLHQVPRHYREWLATLDNLDRHLKFSLEQVALTDFALPKPGSFRPGAPRTIFIPRRNT